MPDSTLPLYNSGMFALSNEHYAKIIPLSATYDDPDGNEHSISFTLMHRWKNGNKRAVIGFHGTGGSSYRRIFDRERPWSLFFFIVTLVQWLQRIPWLGVLLLPVLKNRLAPCANEMFNTLTSRQILHQTMSRKKVVLKNLR